MHSLLTGQFYWSATQTRPDILFECCDLLGKTKSPTIDDAKRANKLVTKTKNKKIVETLKKEDNLVGSKLHVFCGASFANKAGRGSQGGYVIF